MSKCDWILLPVKLSSFDQIKEAVFEKAGNTVQSRRALLACDEVLTNIVSYSGATRLSFSCHLNGDMLCIAFSDDGTPFDPVTAPSAHKEFEQMDTGGMGLDIVRQSGAKMEYSFQNGCNTLYLQFPVEESDGLQGFD